MRVSIAANLKSVGIAARVEETTEVFHEGKKSRCGTHKVL